MAANVDNILGGIYYNVGHPASYGSVRSLTKSSGLKKDEVLQWLSGQDTYSLHKRIAKRRFRRRKTISPGINKIWQADLIDMQKFARNNKGFHFILTIIDIFSRRAWAAALKDKRGETVAQAFNDLFKSEGQMPEKIQTDAGREFYNSAVAHLFKKHSIKLYSTYGSPKASIVERFNQTLLNMLYKYFHKMKTRHYLDILRDVVWAYNHRKHRTIGMAPVNVSEKNEKALWHRLYQNQFPTRANYTYKVGDRVRILSWQYIFSKGYTPSWSQENFIISHRLATNPVTYKVKALDQETILGSFYPEQLQLISSSKAEIDPPIKNLRSRTKRAKAK